MKKFQEMICIYYLLIEIVVISTGLIEWQIRDREDGYLFKYLGEFVSISAGIGVILFLGHLVNGIANKLKPMYTLYQLGLSFLSIIVPFIFLLIVVSRLQ